MAHPQDPFVQHGGQEPPDEAQDRPEQNVGYDEAVKGAPLTPEERRHSEGAEEDDDDLP